MRDGSMASFSKKRILDPYMTSSDSQDIQYFENEPTKTDSNFQGFKTASGKSISSTSLDRGFLFGKKPKIETLSQPEEQHVESIYPLMNLGRHISGISIQKRVNYITKMIQAFYDLQKDSNHWLYEKTGSMSLAEKR